MEQGKLVSLVLTSYNCVENIECILRSIEEILEDG